jgi:hypothetical protein
MQTELMHIHIINLYVCAEHMHQELMRALSICIRNKYVRWAYESGTRACAEHMIQELMHALSTLRIKNLCVDLAYASRTYACSEHTHRVVLVHVLSICAKNLYTVAEHTHQFLTRMLSISVTIPNLKRSLLDMLSIHVRNSCVHWAYTSGTYAFDQRAHKNLTDAKFLKNKIF